MVLFVLFILSCAGASYWTGHAKITEGLRKRMENFLRRELPERADFLMCGVKCMACTSWWYGFVVGVLRGNEFFHHWGLHFASRIEQALVLAFAACISSFSIGVLTGLIKR